MIMKREKQPYLRISHKERDDKLIEDTETVLLSIMKRDVLVDTREEGATSNDREVNSFIYSL